MSQNGRKMGPIRGTRYIVFPSRKGKPKRKETRQQTKKKETGQTNKIE
jgi:hypothetical protein